MDSDLVEAQRAQADYGKYPPLDSNFHFILAS